MAGRWAAFVVMSVLVAAVPAHASASSGAATPHMDRVLAAMRAVAPDLEGVAYVRTRGNRLAGVGGRSSSWILQTPDCWGQRACGDPVGIPRFLRTLESDVASARRVVDLTTLMPFPTGAFQAAIVRGLRRARAAGHRPVVRALGGCYLGCSLTPPEAQAYADALARATGGGRVIVSAYRFPAVGTPATEQSMSWNHAKSVTVDGRVTVVGGHNLWDADYVQGYPARPVTNPVHDVSIRVEGPAARGVQAFTNGLWRRACADAVAPGAPAPPNGAVVAFAGAGPRTCPASLVAPTAPAPGTVEVLGFGRLGLLGVPAPAGVVSAPDRGGPLDPAPCPSGLPYWTPGGESPDWTNDRSRFGAYDPRNPAEAGFRALIASARRSVFIAQQDLHGLCPAPSPGVQPRFDRRLLDVIARRLLAGVDVRVIVSTPGATLGAGVGYSYTTSLAQTSAAVRARTRAVAGDERRARRAVARHFRLAAIRFGPSRVWPRARAPYNRIANHAKVGMVDDCAIWVGSHNLYPAWLSEYSALIEDRAAARAFRAEYAEPLWRNSTGARLPGRACA